MSYCCENCFSDLVLKQYIKECGDIGSCDYCLSENVYCIDTGFIYIKIKPLVEIYDIVENVLPTDSLRELYDSGEGRTIFDELFYNWEVLSIEDYDLAKKLIDDIFNNTEHQQFAESPIISKSDYYGTEITITNSLKSKWEQFCEEIRCKNRYFPEKTFDVEILKSLTPILRTQISKDQTLYRSRKSDKNQKYDCHDMGKPPREKTSSGRANPQGITYLYLSSDKLTCLKETRPNILDSVTIGYFKCKEDLEFIDLNKSTLDSPFKYDYELKHILDHLGFIGILNEEISKPKDRELGEVFYVPFQYITEYFKKLGFDGIIYKSSISEGVNYAIFYEEKMKCYHTELVSYDIILKNKV